MKKIFSLVIVLFSVGEIWSLPLYTARSGRICDNCHSTPFKTASKKEWKNPELAERKCNLSCQTCHVNPGGGGIRTVVGRYYALNTLPMWGARKRPYWDTKRKLFAFLDTLSGNSQQAAHREDGDLQIEWTGLTAQEQQLMRETLGIQKKRLVEPKPFYLPVGYGANPSRKSLKTFYPEDPISLGTPFGVDNARDQSDYAFWHGRYGNLNADPFVTTGLNARLAYVSQNGDQAFFPMQFDVGSAIHPFEHVTATGTLGFEGRFSENDTRSLLDRAVMQNAFLMVHELPYMLYARGGIFRPQFGHGIEDHTAYVRSEFENSVSSQSGKVIGGEIGMAPNYPYISIAGFTNDISGQEPDGYGGSVNLGWRDLAWGAGSSAMHKVRSELAGGNFTAFSLYGYLNPARWWRQFPVTILGEIDAGRKDKLDGLITTDRWFTANFVELNYLLANGINLRLGHHFYDNDIEIRDDELSRWGVGYDVTFFPGARWSTDLRYIRPFDETIDPYWSFVTFLHFYL